VKKILLLIVAVMALASTASAQNCGSYYNTQPGVSVSVGTGGFNNGVGWGINVGTNPYAVGYPVYQSYPVVQSYPVYQSYPVQVYRPYPVYNAPGYCPPRPYYSQPYYNTGYYNNGYYNNGYGRRRRCR
jgi:hypothetical protein